MPIKWSTLKVGEAMDKVEIQAARIIAPLQEAQRITKEALAIPNLPEYIKQHLTGMLGDIESIIGYTAAYDKQFHPGKLIAGIRRVRDELPKGAIEAETERLRQGITKELF